MTERREHWDDDLVSGVSAALGTACWWPHDLYAIIAAVEDWHTRRVHVPDAFGDRCGQCQGRWPCKTIRALDGPE